MEFTRREVNDIVILALSGEIEIFKTAGVQAEIKQLIAEKQFRLVLDMERVPFIDSTGIGMLLLFHRNLKDAGGALKLAKLSPGVEQVFRLTRLIQVFQVFDSEEAALASFG